MERLFNYLLNLVIHIPSTHRRRILGQEHTITSAEVALNVNTLKSGKAAHHDEIQHEILNVLREGVLCV